MATTSFTIYSRYNPVKDKERLQLETVKYMLTVGKIIVMNGYGRRLPLPSSYKLSDPHQSSCLQLYVMKLVVVNQVYQSHHLHLEKDYWVPRSRHGIAH